MQNNELKISIAHLYPKLLNIYGDLGNITAIKKRCEDRNILVNIENIDIGDDIDISRYDLYFIGGGQDKQQIEVANELKKHKISLGQAAENGAVFLAICGGYQLLGKYYQPHDGAKLDGIGILDVITIAGNKRFIGNVTVETDFLEPKTLVGFENHSGLTYLEGDTKPLGKAAIGKGNNGKDFYEGARCKNVFGTYLHGSLLPKNPAFTDYLISLSLKYRYGEEIELKKLDDDFEIQAHMEAVGRTY